MKASKLIAMAATMTAATAFAATPDALIHRWSFNNSLEDTGSIGGMTATLGGNAALYNKTSVRVNAGGNGTSWVELGANPIPSSLGDTPFTIEVWATPREIRNYASVFALGERSNSSAKGLMGVFHGYRQVKHDDSGASGWGSPVWQALGGTVDGGTGKNVGMAQSGISTDTPYYFAYVVTPKGDSSATIIGYVYNASTGALVGKSGMYTATNWTTADMVQNSFNLGTTPWNDNNPGADYDEVRVWKTALTPGQVAAHVAHGPDAIPGDGSVSDGRLRTESATLAHRWSFNGSLADSVTGDTATMKGGYYAANGAVRFAGGNKGDYEIALGANKMPSDSVTLEFFSTTRTLGWPKMFCLGNSDSDGISFSFQRGSNPDAGISGIEIYDTSGGHYVNGIPNALESDKPYHFTFTFSCDGTDTVLNGYCIDMTNPGVIRGQFTRTITGWKLTEKITLNTFNLGWSFWGDGAPNADFDEVRVWDGVLSEEEVLASAAAGADATINPSFPEAPEDLIHRWSFNGNLEDSGSIGLNTATLKGNAGLLNGNSVRVNAGGNGTSWVELGGNPIPTSLGDTPFTIEVWATPNSIQNYASVFSLSERGTGGDPSVKGLMGVFHGYRQVRESGDAEWGACMQPLCGSMSNVAMTQGGISTGTAYYFAYVVTPQGNGSATLMGYVYNAYTGVLVGQSVMRTVTGWTTEQLVQSTFNLGTTCWNNNNPGADYDEVRVWKKALTADQVAVSVRCGPDVVPGASATVNPVVEEGKPATLLHRWSFNGSLTDTGVYGGSDAVTFGTAELVDGTSVRTYKGGENSSYVSLGANMIPASLGNTPFTIEMWATPNEEINYRPAFMFGKPDDTSASNKGLMFVFHGYGQIANNGNINSLAPVFQPLGSSIHNKNVSISSQKLAVGARSHISLVVEPKTDDTVTITGYIHDDAGNLIGSYAQAGITGWNATLLTQYSFLLSRNPWHDGNHSADYDEVRIWSRAFTAGELAVNAKNGPDTVIDFDASVAPDEYLQWVQSTGSQYLVLPGVTGRTGTKIQAVIGGFSGGGQVLVGSHSSAGYISWKDDGYAYPGMGYKDKTDWGLNTHWSDLYANGKGTLTSQISPSAFTLDFNGASGWYGTSFNPNALSESDKTAYDTGLDMYVFALNDNGTAANHASAKLYSLKIWQTATEDGTGDYTLAADLKPCMKYGTAALYDAVSGKVLLSASASPLTAGPVSTLEPHSSGCLMDYTFTSGEMEYSGAIEDPVTIAAGYTPTHGTNGYGTAVHAAGYGIDDAFRTTLAGEWTLATSFKSCDIEKGVLLSLGNIPATGTKQLAILSSSTEGRLYAAVVQRWGGTTEVNRSFGDQTIEVSGADFANEFHTLVVTHVPTDATHTGVLTVYVDGVQVHQFTTVGNGEERAFGNGFRFGALMDNGRTTSLPSDIASTAYCPDTAFQNVRLYDKLLSADEIKAYAVEFPAAAATKGSIGDYGFRHSFSTGKLVSDNGTFASTGGFNDSGLAGTGEVADAPSYAAEGVKACFPSKAGYGTVTGGLNRDWTIAMSVKGPAVASGTPAAIFSFGGIEEGQKRSIALCSSSTGSLFVQMVQNWGDGVNAPVSLDLGGDVSSMFHTIVIVNERNIKTDEDLDLDWKTGMISFYLDGEYVGALESCNGQDRSLMDMIRYGALYNRTHESVVEPDASSGLSFQDLRFIPQVWTSAEAKDYTAAFPVAPAANVTLEVSGNDDFAGSQQIAITGGGQIYYTLDGTEPTPENGTLYSGAFTLAGSAQFRARAFFNGQPVSRIVERTFTEATDTVAYDYVFRYNFTDGAKIYNHHGCATEPAGTAAGYAAVHGTNGYAKAIHPTGYGTIVDGMARLNNDWTLAMCVKPGDLEKGILLSLGDNNALNTKELAICSSSTAGKIHVAVVQKWTTDTGVPQYKNLPFAYDIPVGGDTAGSFHSLVVTHVAKTAYDAGTGQAWSGVITFYWDGDIVNAFAFDSSLNGGEREFGNGFKFGGLHDGITSSLSQQGYVETAYDVESAFRDVRFYARTLTEDEIAGYAAMFPAAASTSGNIGTFDFRHNFTGGSLAVTGSAFTDNGIAAATAETLGPADDDSAKAAWPGMAGYGTIGGVNMNGDWTLAMSVKAPKVSDDEKGLMVTLGGVNASGTKALAIGSTADSTGGLFFGLAQRWGGSTDAINTCNGQVVLTGLGETTKEFHSLVIVHASGLRTNNADYWKTGTYAIYWDGVYKGAVATDDGAGQNIGNFIKYGSLHDRMPAYHAEDSHYPHYVETDSSESGLAFRDLRFAGRMWTGTEVKAYSQAFPAVRQKSRGITLLVY